MVGASFGCGGQPGVGYRASADVGNVKVCMFLKMKFDKLRKE